MKKQIMKRAWILARAGQAVYGGSVRAYFSEALKLAWKETRMEKTVEYKKINLSEKYAKAAKEAALREQALRTNISDKRRERAQKRLSDFLSEKKTSSLEEIVYFVFGNTYSDRENLKKTGWSYLGGGNNFWWSRENLDNLGYMVIDA